jgi:hypothetical protein
LSIGVTQEPTTVDNGDSPARRVANASQARKAAKVSVDDVVPTYHFCVVNGWLIEASPEATRQASHEVCRKDAAFGRVLSALRSLPIRLLKRDPSKIASRDLPDLSRPPVPMLIEQRTSAHHFGRHGQDWAARWAGPQIGVADLVRLASYEPVWTKLAGALRRSRLKQIEGLPVRIYS